MIFLGFLGMYLGLLKPWKPLCKHQRQQFLRGQFFTNFYLTTSRVSSKYNDLCSGLLFAKLFPGLKEL